MTPAKQSKEQKTDNTVDTVEFDINNDTGTAEFELSDGTYVKIRIEPTINDIEIIEAFTKDLFADKIIENIDTELNIEDTPDQKKEIEKELFNLLPYEQKTKYLIFIFSLICEQWNDKKREVEELKDDTEIVIPAFTEKDLKKLRVRDSKRLAKAIELFQSAMDD